MNYQVAPSWLIGIEADAAWADGCTAAGCATAHTAIDTFGTVVIPQAFLQFSFWIVSLPSEPVVARLRS